MSDCTCLLPVWIHDCTNSVCNGYYSALLKWCSQSMLNVSIRFCIYICCCLINAQDLWHSKKILSKLTPWSTALLKKLMINKLQPFMRHEGSLPCQQNSEPYPESDDLVHIHTSYFFKTHFNIILHFKLRSANWTLSFAFSEENSEYISDFLIETLVMLYLWLCICKNKIPDWLMTNLLINLVSVIHYY
jgi:hypothetical protein